MRIDTRGFSFIEATKKVKLQAADGRVFKFQILVSMFQRTGSSTQYGLHYKCSCPAVFSRETGL